MAESFGRAAILCLSVLVLASNAMERNLLPPGGVQLQSQVEGTSAGQKGNGIFQTAKSSLPGSEFPSEQGFQGLRTTLGLMTNSAIEGNIGVDQGGASLVKSKYLATKSRRIIKRRKIVKKKIKKSSSSSTTNVKNLRISSSLVPSAYRPQNSLLEKIGPVTPNNFLNHLSPPKENVPLNSPINVMASPKDTFVMASPKDIIASHNITPLNNPMYAENPLKVPEQLLKPTTMPMPAKSANIENLKDISAPLNPISGTLSSLSLGTVPASPMIPKAEIQSFNVTISDEKQKNGNNSDNMHTVIGNNSLPFITMPAGNISNQISDITTPRVPKLKPKFFLIKEPPKLLTNSTASTRLAAGRSILVRELSTYAKSRRFSSNTSSSKTRHVISEKIIHEVDPSSIPTKRPAPIRRIGGPKFFLIRDPPHTNASEKAQPVRPKLIQRRIVSNTSENSSSSTSEHSSSSENSTSSAQFLISGVLTSANNVNIEQKKETIPSSNINFPSNTSNIASKQNILPSIEIPTSNMSLTNLTNLNLKNIDDPLLKSNLINLPQKNQPCNSISNEPPIINNSKYEIRPPNMDVEGSLPLSAQGFRRNTIQINSNQLRRTSTRKVKTQRKIQKSSRKVTKKSSQLLQNSAMMDSSKINSVLK